MREGGDEVQKLIFEGFGALEIGEFERALRVARELHEHHHTSAFEIEARARWDLEDHERAIEVLKEGVEVAPDQFVLWDYLASYLSDEGRFEEALQAYYRSRECTGAPTESVDFNIAVIYQREERHERALALIDAIQPTESVPIIVLEGARAYSLNEVGKHSDALARTAACLSLIGEDQDVEPEAVARLLSEHAYALWILGIHEAAYLEALEAVVMNKHNKRAAWLVREILDERSADAKAWRITVKGRWAQPNEDSDKDYGFFANYVVVADSPEDALEYIRPFEPEEVRFTLKIDSAVDMEPRPDSQKGVYEAMGYAFFPLEEGQ